MNYESEQAAKAMKAALGSDNESLPGTPVKPVKKDKRLKKKESSEEDTDFKADTEEELSDDQASGAEEAQTEAANLADDPARPRSTSALVKKSLYKQNSAGASQVSSKSTPKSTPKKPKGKAKNHGSVPAIKLSPGKVVKGKTGAHRIAKLKSVRDGKKYGTVIVAKALRPLPEVVDLTKEDTNQLGPLSQPRSLRLLQTNVRPPVKPFNRVIMPVRSPHEAGYNQYPLVDCPACRKQHPRGACEFKASGVEHCGLCGLAHYGIGRTCPHIKSETQVREMMQALKSSPEKKELVDLAMKYLRGVKGTLVQAKKKEREKALIQAGGMPPANQGPTALGRLPATMYHLGPGQHVQNSRPGYQRTGVTQQAYPAFPSTPGSMAGHTPGQAPNYPAVPPRGGAQQGRWTQQDQHQHAAPIDDQHVESALRGFLGQGN